MPDEEDDTRLEIPGSRPSPQQQPTGEQPTRNATAPIVPSTSPNSAAEVPDDEIDDGGCLCI